MLHVYSILMHWCLSHSIMLLKMTWLYLVPTARAVLLVSLLFKPWCDSTAFWLVITAKAQVLGITLNTLLECPSEAWQRDSEPTWNMPEAGHWSKRNPDIIHNYLYMCFFHYNMSKCLVASWIFLFFCFHVNLTWIYVHSAVWTDCD